MSQDFDFTHEYQIEVVNPCLSLLGKFSDHYQLNVEKIKQILLLILNELYERDIRRSNDIIVLTAAIIWHNTLNRPGDRDYIEQQELEKKMDKKLNAVRYLRRELGIEQRTYDSIQDFIDDLTSPEDIELEGVLTPKDVQYWGEVRNFIQKKIIQRKRPNQSILEASTFLYFNENRSFTKNELWSVSKGNVDYVGNTPAASFKTELSRYSINSKAKKKRSPLIFRIMNLEENSSHELQLLSEMRSKIDRYVEKKGYQQLTLKKELAPKKQEEELNEFLIVHSNKGQSHQLDDKVVKKRIQGPEFVFKGRGSITRMIFDSGKYYLMKDSIMLNEYKDYFAEGFTGLINLREELIQKGYFTKNSNGNYVLNINLRFNSSSPIVCLCAGGSYNGFRAFKWVNDPEISLKEYQKNKHSQKNKPSSQITRDGNQYWVCPKSSCGYKKIMITRNEDNIIENNTYSEIIIHFLQHLKRSNPLFGSSDIIPLFMDHTGENILSDEDKGEYIYDGHTSDLIWKNQIRSSLNHLRGKGLIGTETSEDLIKKCNYDIEDRRKKRKRKRTELFFKDYKLYNDWELYPMDEEDINDFYVNLLEQNILDKRSKPKKPVIVEEDDEEVEEIDENLDIIYENSNLLEEIKQTLLLKKQIILMGPPGTSKSYLADQIALMLTDGKRNNIEFVQFHPSYTYEDFVECNTVEPDDSNNSLLSFKPKKKIFRKFCAKAEKEKEDTFVFIIDEINRGNVERIFGELIYCLENRNKKIKSTYFQNEDFSIPENILIIATMNTVDLSITNIDIALRRRFYIIDLMPNPKVLENWLDCILGDYHKDFQGYLVEFMGGLNNLIKNHHLMGNYRTIGHAFFMLKKIEEKSELEEILTNLRIEWNYAIRPTLLEYVNFSKKELKIFDNEFQKFYDKIVSD